MEVVTTPQLVLTVSTEKTAPKGKTTKKAVANTFFGNKPNNFFLIYIILYALILILIIRGYRQIDFMYQHDKPPTFSDSP